MAPIKNGPAKNTPKGARLTRADLAATVPAAPARCHCPTGPVTIGVFRNQQLVDVQQMHLRARGCFEPTGRIEPRAYQAGIGR